MHLSRSANSLNAYRRDIAQNNFISDAIDHEAINMWADTHHLKTPSGRDITVITTELCFKICVNNIQVFKA